MEPSFSKNLGPVTVDNLKSLLRCKLINFSGSESFENLLGYKKLVPKTRNPKHFMAGAAGGRNKPNPEF